MNQLVLHHDPDSPFSEKIRLILGFKALHWTSVHIPAIMPKPDVVAPIEGYLDAASAERISIARVEPRAGRVAVHFPRLGFELRRAK